jgi:hypothetical protein
MATNAKRWRLLGIGATVIAVLALVVVMNRPVDKGFEKPAECVEALYEASKDGKDSDARLCLTPALHGELETIMAKKQDVKSWATQEFITGKAAAYVDTDEVRAGSTGTQRLRYHLEKNEHGWLIVGVGAPAQVTGTVPYGTHISENPNP